MSKFDVTLLNSKSPFGEAAKKIINDRLNELTGNPYQRMFEAENCDNPSHAEYQNKVTLDFGTSRMDLDCCCMAFTDHIKSMVGGK